MVPLVHPHTGTKWYQKCFDCVGSTAKGFAGLVATDMAKDTKGAAELIKKHPIDVQKALIQSCLRPDSALSIDEKAKSCGVPPEDLQAALEGSRQLVSSLRPLKEATATSLLEDLCLDPEVAALLKSLVSTNIGKTVGPLSKLVNIKWKVGVSAMSDQCKNLNSPFVILQLTVEDSSNCQSCHTVELTISEFQKFASAMQELHGIMSTM